MPTDNNMVGTLLFFKWFYNLSLLLYPPYFYLVYYDYMSSYKRYFIQSSNFIFITIVTNNRIPILIDNIELLRTSFKYVKEKFKFQIFAATILNDHLHLILKLTNVHDYPKIIRLMKFYFSYHIDKGRYAYALPSLQLSDSKIKKHEKGIWQRRYWEHTIRDETDLHRHIDYIHYNSMKHYNIAPNDYPYSSFAKFVKSGYYDNDWCNFGDKYNIEELDYE